MPQPHDVGGKPDAGPIPRANHELEDWEVLADAVVQALNAKKVWNIDLLRRCREKIPSELYPQLGYYERWIYGAEEGLIELGVLRREEIDQKVADSEPRWRS